MSDTKNAPKPWESDYRISQDTQPLHYDLYLFPNLQTDTFSGRVTIHIDARTPQAHLVAHVKNLKITATTVLNLRGR